MQIRSLFAVLFYTLCLFCSHSAKASLSVLETLDSVRDTSWSFSAFSLTSTDVGGLQTGGTGFTNYAFASANYRLDPSSKISFRAPFVYNSAGYKDFGQTTDDQKQQILLQDLIVSYTQYNLALLPGDIDVFWELRGYLPTSRGSYDKKQIGAIRNDFILSKIISEHFELEYISKFTWNIQTQTAYLNEDASTADQTKYSNTKYYELDHWAVLWYKAAHNLGFGAFIGGEDTWYHESKYVSTSRQRDGRLAEHLIKIGPAFRFTLNKNFNFILNISNKVPLSGYHPDTLGKNSDIGLFKPNQTQFVLMAFLNF